MNFSLGQLLFGVGGLLAGVGALFAFVKIAELAQKMTDKLASETEEGEEE